MGMNIIDIKKSICKADGLTYKEVAQSVSLSVWNMENTYP